MILKVKEGQGKQEEKRKDGAQEKVTLKNMTPPFP